tara:strand:+ start:4841 stop:5695 length:855 start_codon:yes stop_codon:yes gene_type:complete
MLKYINKNKTHYHLIGIMFTLSEYKYKNIIMSYILNTLFQATQDMNVALKGQLITSKANISQNSYIQLHQLDLKPIEEIFYNLQAENPEAGGSYYKIRIWSLICWQPIHIALISIYACNGLPLMHQIGQFCHSTSIYGYFFEKDIFHQSSHDHLTRMAGEQLQTLFYPLLRKLKEHFSISFKTACYVLGDITLMYLLHLNKYLPHFKSVDLSHCAKIWIKVLNLPTSMLSNLTQDPVTHLWHYRRTSCCFAYQCHHQNLCLQCPKQPKPKKFKYPQPIVTIEPA